VALVFGLFQREAMLTRALDGALDPQRALSRVKVGPPQPEYFIAPRARECCDRDNREEHRAPEAFDYSARN
jgi:hypothetical protein